MMQTSAAAADADAETADTTEGNKERADEADILFFLGGGEINGIKSNSYRTLYLLPRSLNLYSTFRL